MKELWAREDERDLAEFLYAVRRDDLVGALFSIEGTPPAARRSAELVLDAAASAVRERTAGTRSSFQKARLLAREPEQPDAAFRAWAASAGGTLGWERGPDGEEAARKFEEFRAGHPFVKARNVRQVADLGADRVAGQDLGAENPRRTAGRMRQAGEEPDHGGLPCAVRSEEAEY